MKIGILTSWLSHRAGGLFESVPPVTRLVQNDQEVQVAVFGLADSYMGEVKKRWGPDVTAVTTLGPRAFGYAPQLYAALRRANLDLLHVHGLWMHYSVASLRWGQATRRACIISPHGMLDPWALEYSRWKKRLALWGYERKHLQAASCLHALSEAEAQAMRAIGLSNPICIIPNGIDTAPPESVGTPSWRRRIPADAKVLLYLGRLHPKKGLPNLLRAWHMASGDPGRDWHLAIAGWDQLDHEQELRGLVRQQGLERVHFLGPQFGGEKLATYAAADAFVLPSVSEGIPMAVLEAWSHGLPVVMTKECNLVEGFSAGAALEIGTGSPEIHVGLDLLFRMSVEQRQTMGKHGRRLCCDQFSLTRSNGMLQAVYRWILGRSPRPDCVLGEIEETRGGRRPLPPPSLSASQSDNC